MGTIALQLAKHVGAYVAVSASAASEARLQPFHPDLFIDYNAMKFHEMNGLQDMDIVLDCVGDQSDFECAKLILKPEGKYISIRNFALGSDPYAHPPLTYAAFFCLYNNPNVQDALAGLLEVGLLHVSIDETFEFTQASVQQMFIKCAGRRSKGKNILHVRK